MNAFTEKDISRFWDKVDKSGGDNACWVWRASRTPLGYGHFGFRRKLLIASRVAWELACGSIPEGLHVLHHCDNPSCCNPKHLFLGTNHENVLDSLKKGRRSSRKGEGNGRAKLTLEQVQIIRERHANGEYQYRLAKEFGVSQVQIGHIVNRKAWV